MSEEQKTKPWVNTPTSLEIAVLQKVTGVSNPRKATEATAENIINGTYRSNPHERAIGGSGRDYATPSFSVEDSTPLAIVESLRLDEVNISPRDIEAEIKDPLFLEKVYKEVDEYKL
ncbi:hypothetical protein GOV05_03525 [Candidatus Woesearchaeota archaeon]|nr:hypothetical protein [Candidatus Woesearchaeota archaeon]